MKSKTKDKEKIKLKIYKAILLTSSILGVISGILLFIFDIIEFSKVISRICNLSGIVFFILAIIFYFLTDKQKRKVMNNSIEYYKQRFSFFAIQTAIIFICLFLSFILRFESMYIKNKITEINTIMYA